MPLILIHHHKRERNTQPERSFVGTGFDTGITMPAFILIGDGGEFTLACTVEHVTRAGIRAFAATFAVFFIYDRGHALNPVKSKQ